MEKRTRKKSYWVQSLYAVIAPNGSAYDYYFSKKEAIQKAKKLNVEEA